MRAWVIVVMLVVMGIVGAWLGYWIGHALGWTTDAEFPLQIGGGDRAIALSILVSVGCVMAGAGWFVARPLMRIRRLLTTGTPGHATVRRMWRTGLYMAYLGDRDRHQVGFELEMHPDTGGDYEAKALGLLSETEETAIRPGAEVTVRYDPADPASIVVVGPMPTATA